MAPFRYWMLALVSVAALFALLRRWPRSPLLLFSAYGFGKYAVGASWVYVSIHEHGNASVVLALFLVLLFVGFLTLLFTATQGLAWKLLSSPKLGDGGQVLLFTGLWVLWEWFQTWVLTGFPWLFAGSGQLASPFAGYLPVGGVLLSSGMLVATACTLWLVAARLTAGAFGAALRPAGLVLLLLGIGLLLNRLSWVEPGLPRSVALVQGNVDQASKWLPENRQRIVERYADLSEPHWGRDLILWPEAAITLFEHQAKGWLQRWGARGQRRGTTLVLGLPGLTPDPRAPDGYHFQALALAIGAGEGRYVKRRLVPFGEYVPLEALLRGAIDFFDLPMSRARPGAFSQPLLDLDGIPAALAICYEIAYPNLISADVPPAQVLLTISNDAWFGASIGPHQHLELAQLRARETGRYVLRATNNGITAIIDHRGRVLDRLPQFQPGVLTGEFRPVTGATPFARAGSLPALILVVLALGTVVFLRAFPRRD